MKTYADSDTIGPIMTSPASGSGPPAATAATAEFTPGRSAKTVATVVASVSQNLT